MAQRRSSSEIILLVGLTIICALLVCDLGSAILGRDSASLFPATSWLYGYPMARSTHYNPLVRWLRLYTGDHIILVPQLWLVAGYDALPWAFDHEKLNQASADLRSWVPHLFALAARPTTYLEFIWFLIVATVLVIIRNECMGALAQTQRPKLDRVADAPCSFGVLRGAFTIFPQLVLASIAPYILLTRPAALGFIAQVIAHAGHVRYLKQMSHPNGELKTHLVMDGVRRLGLAIALDVLVFGGRLKLEVTGLLGTIARLENIAGSDSYGILSWILEGTTLFESFFFPKRAAMMNGPLINASRALGVEEWLGRPKTLPWRLLVPHGYLHALVCVALGLFLFRTFLLRIPDRRVYHLSAIALLLWTGFGAAGTLFFAVLFFCVEAYASAGCPSPVPSWIWLAWQTQIKLEAMRHLQVLEHSFREASEALEERVRERVRELQIRNSPAKEDPAAGAAAKPPNTEARLQSQSKAADGGSNRTNSRQAAPSPAMQPEKQPASRMPGKAPNAHRDKAACPQQPPAHAEMPSQTLAEQSRRQAPDHRNDRTSMEQPEYAQSQAALQTAQKQKAARRKTAKNKGANLQTKPSASSDGSSTPDSSSQKGHREQVTAPARVPAVAASAKPVRQPPRTLQSLQNPSSHGDTAPQTAPETPHRLQQSTSQNVQSASSSSSSTAPDAGARRPCPPVPDMPHGWPTDAPAAPVRLSKTTLQHSQSSAAQVMPPPLHALLPTSAPLPENIQALLGLRPADQASAQSRAPQQQPHAEAQHDADRAQNKVGREEEVTQQDCIMCWEEPRQATLAPCGHRALCSSCTQLVLKTPDPRCPICRSIVQSFILKEFDV